MHFFKIPKFSFSEPTQVMHLCMHLLQVLVGWFLIMYISELGFHIRSGPNKYLNDNLR